MSKDDIQKADAILEAYREWPEAVADAVAERDALAARVELLEAALAYVKGWCERNLDERAMIYTPVCEALKGGK